MLDLFPRMFRTLLLLLPLVVAACGGPSAPAPEPLTVAVSRTLPSALVILASEHGHFARAGLDVTLVPADHAADALADLLDGGPQLALTSDVLFARFALADPDPDLRIIAAVDQADASRCVVRAGRGIATPADLRGRRVGYVPGTASEFYAELFLDSNGLKRTDVDLIPMDLPRLRRAFAEDLADAVFVWNTVAWELAAETSAQVWSVLGEYPMMFVIVAPRVVVENRPAALAAFVSALCAAEEQARADPAGARATVARFTGLRPETVGATWNDHLFTVTLNRALMLTLEEATRWLLRHRPVADGAMPNYIDHISFAALEAVRPESATIIR